MSNRVSPADVTEGMRLSWTKAGQNRTYHMIVESTHIIAKDSATGDVANVVVARRVSHAGKVMGRKAYVLRSADCLIK